MASMKLTCWLIVLLFTAWFSNANAHQDENAAAEVDAVSRGKKVLGGESTVNVATDGGRRMGAVRQGKRLVKVKGAGASVQGVQFGGEYENQGKMSNGDCKNRRGSQFPEEVDQKEFVAFNADYRAPRHHPPKNN